MKSRAEAVEDLPSRATGRPALVALVVAFGLLALLDVLVQRAFSLAAVNHGVRVNRFANTDVVLCFGWVVLSPGVLYLSRRFDPFRKPRWRALLVHLGTALACHALLMLLLVLLPDVTGTEGLPFVGRIRMLFFLLLKLQFNLLIYVAIVLADRAVHLATAARERELRASRLEAQAARARLETLATRMQPHFLFNALHAIGTQINVNPVAARALLVEFSALLRELLADGMENDISLRRELELLRRYLDIERMRFPDRLSVEVAVPESLLGQAIPPFLLQPLVENALRHGIASTLAAGMIRIEAVVRGPTLTLSVWNNGVLSGQGRDGVGLATTRERLTTRFGPAATLVLREARGGVEAVVEMPVSAAA